MNLRACSYEKELNQALKEGHWPDACADDLRDHVNRCELCRDLILVTQAFRHAKRASIQVAPAGSPELLWWRAQLRRRRVAAETVSRPIAIAQIFAWVISLVIAIGFVASQYNRGLRWESWGISPSKFLHSISATLTGWDTLVFLPGLAAVVVISGLVLYLATDHS